MMELLATILPALLTMIVTYFVANKRVRLQQMKLMTDMQVKAIESITTAEAQMRKEIWEELEKSQTEVSSYKEKTESLTIQLTHTKELLEKCEEEIVLLKKQNSINEEEILRQKTQINELENR